MAKFEMELELTGFKLKIKGEREDVGVMGAAIKGQLASMIMPSGIADEQTPPPVVTQTSEHKTIEGRSSSRKSSKKRAPSATTEGGSVVIEFQHDPLHFGNPVQTWRPVEKSMWLIYVVSHQSANTRLSPTEIAETFARYFGKAGTLRPSNVSRDLGTQKSANPPLVSQDIKTQKFGLFEAGETYVKALIQSAIAPK